MTFEEWLEKEKLDAAPPILRFAHKAWQASRGATIEDIKKLAISSEFFYFAEAIDELKDKDAIVK